MNRGRATAVGRPPFVAGLSWSMVVLLLWIGLGLAGCHRREIPEPPPRPSLPPGAGQVPAPGDDGDRESLKRAVSASIRYWQGQGPTGRPLTACGRSQGPEEFLAALSEFQGLLNRVPFAEFPAAVAKGFDLCPVATGDGKADILVTGYYQPRFQARLERQPPFIHPLYRLPPDLIQAQLFAEGVSRTVGRLEGGRLVPYWTRAEIETSDRLKGLELCYLADPVEAFLLQVQGSGLLELADGSVRQLLFAGTNGRSYRSIGRLLAAEGRIPLPEIDMPRITRYLHEHLDEQGRILHYNERFVFFRLQGQGEGGPVGSMGEVLTPGRSVALDQERFPVGGLYFLATERPAAEGESPAGWRPLTRFVLHQDTGAAIKGPGRLDFFWGSGPYPERAAGLMKQPGRLYVVIRKQEPGYRIQEPGYRSDRGPRP